ncbi:MAG: DNA repair protein RecN [Gammaproteobacteria bacterium]
MLKQLNIHNFAIIEELELLFRPGLTVFTGETGAGKSILVDALGLVLGDRADSSIIREACQRAEITAIFDIKGNANIISILHDQAMEAEGHELHIRRVISKDGRSRGYVNNSPATVQLLQTLGENLVDIHGQHTHQSLTKRDIQRDLLDEFGVHAKELAKVATACNDWNEATTRLAALQGNTDTDATRSLLRYQIQELETLDPRQDEYDRLGEEYKRLANASHLVETVQKALYGFYEDEHSVYSQINKMLSDLRECRKFDESLGNITPILDDACIQLSEAGDELRAYLETLHVDPVRLQKVEERLSDLHEMARKHQVQAQQLTEHLHRLKEKLKAMENSEQIICGLQEQQQLAMEQYRYATRMLHQCRKKAAGKMSTDITAKLKELGMPDGQFEITVNSSNDPKPKPSGNDQIEFLVNINPGQALQSLRKVASGGELSRISLAIQVIGSSYKGIPSLVFDEIDAGIGGGVAEIVGQQLHALAERRQVFCVTHLPQVASQGDHHLQVKKSSNKTTTRTGVNTLSGEQRVDEIARMLGGVNITAQSRRHAEEMLSG